MSRSMLLRGCFLAAKKVAVALDTLIRTQYPRDHLTVIGFAYYAREIRPGALAELSWHGYEYGTNLQHGLLLARRILAREAAANKEIVVITDGEPTAHFEDGQVEFSYPPTRRTISETLREVQRCTKEGITINTFMLERSRALAEFVAHMTKLNRGRAFYATPERLGRVRAGRLRRTALEAGVVGAILAGRPAGRSARRAREGSMDLAWLFPWLLFLHVLGAIVAFGPTFAFSFIGAAGGAEPQHANFATRVSHTISSRLVYPIGLTLPITGLAMMAVRGINPFERGVLVAGRRDRPVPHRLRLFVLRPAQVRRAGHRALVGSAPTRGDRSATGARRRSSARSSAAA